jgi:exopolyphosphatase/guanosine-5'-triphosphate,3'-diphosphate pyrophosphatase
VRGACIDIGSNTTRLLVADCEGDSLREVHQERAFTRISRGLSHDGTIPRAKIAEVADVVARQLERARELGADSIQAVATAAIRTAANGHALAEAIHAASGMSVRILTGAEEARLAFVGAAGTLEVAPDGPLGVVDVGGGSSELVVGRAPDEISWSASFAVGSGDLTDDFVHSDPPTADQLHDARDHVLRVFDGLDPPRVKIAIAVGGSATSLRVVAGDVLDAGAFAQTIEVLASATAAELARRYTLDETRMRLLPAGLVIMRAASELFETPLQIGHGGIREGVLLEAGR